MLVREANGFCTAGKNLPALANCWVKRERRGTNLCACMILWSREGGTTNKYAPTATKMARTEMIQRRRLYVIVPMPCSVPFLQWRAVLAVLTTYYGASSSKGSSRVAKCFPKQVLLLRKTSAIGHLCGTSDPAWPCGAGGIR